jgi:RluA family pseudouridine synthase
MVEIGYGLRMRNRAIPEITEHDKARVRAMVIYEDAHVLAFNKPSGLAVQTRGNRGTSLDHLLWTFARSNGKRPDLVHRIDVGTSGIIIAAKTKPATAFFNAAFAERRAAKRYLAIVSGDLPIGENGVCDLALRKSGRRVFAEGMAVPPPDARDKRAPDALGAAMTARTDWHVLARVGDKALIEARPLTGRMHQIRAHLAGMGCAILGDHIYGEKRSAPRLMLHAAGLTLPYPDTKELADKKELALEAPVPDDFSEVQARLGL